MVPEPSRPGDQTVAGCSVSGARTPWAEISISKTKHLQPQALSGANILEMNLSAAFILTRCRV